MLHNNVQVGRVVIVTYGPDAGKMAVVVAVIDHQRMLVEGPQVKRQGMSVKRCVLTAVVAAIPRDIGSVALMKKLEDQQIAHKISETAWQKKKQARQTRLALSDFDRFKVMLARKKYSTILGKACAKQ